MKILEVNDNDIYGKIFNGYDIMNVLNKKEEFKVKQAVINKLSHNKNVVRYFNNIESIDFDIKLHKMGCDLLSTHSLLSVSALMLKNSKYYRNSDLVHYHQVHNSRFCLPTFFKMLKEKPSVISLHDPWFMTGRCVHPMKCEKWKSGCNGCKYLDTLFDLEKDNCDELYKIKSQIKDSDVDVIVHSDFMYNMAKKSPYLKKLRIHNIPFGLDVKKYDFKLTKEEAKDKLNIPTDHIVIFFREQKELKGTNYIVEAMKNMKNKENITILTCSQKGLLKEIEDEFNVIELGVLEEKDINLCYNASDLFLMPSIAESFGMMAIEAMASGIPTIVFDNTALPFTTGAPEYGILVKNLDSNDLREKIEYYIENPDERIKRGIASKKFVEKKYDLNKYFDRIEKIYEKAYELQKYKLSHKSKQDRKIDFENENIKRILPKLNEIYTALFVNNKPLFSLDNLDSDNKKINFSDSNVQYLIEEFNNTIYTNLLNERRKKNKITIVMDEEKKEPKVSIIIPVYNGGNYISLAIDSALRQTYKNIEIIVVNDGSEDNTDKVCKAYGKKIKYIKKENGGVSTALNLGIENMTGDYFSWLSHDDLYYPEKIEKEISYLEENNLINSKTILYSDYDMINAKGESLGTKKFNTKELNKDSYFSLLKGAINGLSLLIPKQAFKEAGMFDVKLRCVQDYQLWLDMIKKSYNFVHIPHSLVVTRVHEQQVTNTSPKVVSEGNEFWLNFIKDINDKEKVRLYGSVYNYYYSLLCLFINSPYDKTIKYCRKKVDEIEKDNTKIANDIKVTVILFFKNNIKSAVRALNSIINQSHKNVEILLINNNSKENTKIIDSIVKKNKNIKYFKNTTTESTGEIFNKGVLEASGEYVCFLNENSCYFQTKIEKQLLKMVCSGDLISHTSYYKNINNKSLKIKTGYRNGFVMPEILLDTNINLSTFMINKKYIEDNNIKFPKLNNCYFEDSLYMLLIKENRLLGIREVLSTTYIKDENIEKKYMDIIKMMLLNLEVDKYIKELNILLNSYKKGNAEDLEKINHTEELKRYSYMLTKEYKIVNVLRKIKNGIIFYDKTNSYKIDNNLIINSGLNRYYRKIKNLKNRIFK